MTAAPEILLLVPPIYGHVAPMLSIGSGLRFRGYGVTVLTGRKYADPVEARGLSFAPLPPEADFDDADLDDWLPAPPPSGRLAAGRYTIQEMFVRPLAAQHQALTTTLRLGSFDGVVSDLAFMGALPTLLGTPAGRRVPIVGVSATPLSTVSVDAAPFGSGLWPAGSAAMRLRNRQINAVLHTVLLRPLHRSVDAALAPFGVPPGTVNYFDQALLYDAVLQLAPRGFEYPRRELPSSVHFVGPLVPESPAGGSLPSWWSDLDGSRPVVHVTQGTMDNADLGKLVAPTFRALADEDVLIVGSTGGRPVGDLLELLGGQLPANGREELRHPAVGGQLPANGRVAEFLPYDALLPRADLMITNGGYGGVQQALRHGVPLIVGGTTEDKPEVAARVSWSGAGLNLWTGRPSPRRLRWAVRRVLRGDRYRSGAARLAAEIAALDDPLDTLVTLLRGVSRPAAVRGRPVREQQAVPASE